MVGPFEVSEKSLPQLLPRKRKVAGFSATSVATYPTTWCHNAENHDGNLERRATERVGQSSSVSDFFSRIVGLNLGSGTEYCDFPQSFEVNFDMVPQIRPLPTPSTTFQFVSFDTIHTAYSQVLRTLIT